MEIAKYVDLVYSSFKDNGRFDDLTDDELTTLLLMESKSLIIEVLYANRKNQKMIQNDKIKRIFKNIGILAKINDINLDE